VGKNIALVDDSKSFCMLVSSLLASRGHMVVAFHDAESFLANDVKRDAFDLFLFDINLPGMDGLEMIACLKSDPELAHTPTLLLTGDATKGRVTQAANYGIAGYIAKPIDPEPFVQRVLAVLALR